MTDELIDKLMELHDKATEGPWEHEIDDYFTTIHAIEPAVASYVSPADAAYIVAACNSIPDLIHRIRELENEVDSLRDALEESENRLNGLLTDEERDWAIMNVRWSKGGYL